MATRKRHRRSKFQRGLKEGPGKAVTAKDAESKLAVEARPPAAVDGGVAPAQSLDDRGEPGAAPVEPMFSSRAAPPERTGGVERRRESLPVVRVWRHRNYFFFEGGWIPHHVTSWIQRVGVMWVAWELTHSNAWVGAVAAADLAPMLFLAPIAGAVADRSRRPLVQLMICKWLLLFQSIALVALSWAGMMTIELLLLLSLFTGIINPFTTASRQIILAASVPRHDFAPAIALDSALFQASRFVGPAIAAWMIKYMDVGSAFMAHVGGSLIVLVSLFFIRLAPLERRSRANPSLLVDISESFRYVVGHAAIWPLFLLLTVGSMMLRPVQDLLPGFADKVFLAGPDGLGWLASAIGLGAMISATWIAMRGKVEGLSRWAIVGGLVLIVSTIGFTSTNQLWLGLIFAGLCGFGLNTLSTSIQTITQSVVSDGMRGRVMSLYSLIFRGMPAVGALVLGTMADRIGLQLSFGIAAGLSLMVWLPVFMRHRVIAEALRREAG